MKIVDNNGLIIKFTKLIKDNDTGGLSIYYKNKCIGYIPSDYTISFTYKDKNNAYFKIIDKNNEWKNNMRKLENDSIEDSSYNSGISITFDNEIRELISQSYDDCE